MARRRVVVTGIGAVTPLGLGIQAFWDSLLNGRSGVGKITYFDVSDYDVKIAAQVRDFNPEAILDRRDINRLDRFCQYGLAAARLALEDSNIDTTKLSEEERRRTGVIVGSGIGGLKEFQIAMATLLQKGPGRVSPLTVPKMIADSASGCIAIKFGLKGPNFVTISACASANHGMGMALRHIQFNEADVIVTGGAEAAVTEIGVAGFASLGALSKRNNEPEKASRPFEKNRDGFVLGEGSAILIFEELEHAKRRGAKIYCEVLGFGQSDDAYHITAPEPTGEGAIACMENAIKDAGLTPDKIDYINAHGTSTPLNDKVETLAIKKLFGSHAYKVPISSTKSMTGHLLGAAAAIELAATCMAIHTGKIHPTINYDEPDPELDLDFVPNKMREHRVDYALSNSFGFGGHNSCVVVGKYY